MPINICNDGHRGGGERHWLDETGCLIEYTRTADAIDITAFHRDLDIDRAVGINNNAGIRQIDLVRLCRNRVGEDRRQRHQKRCDHDDVPASNSKVARCRTASSGTITNVSLCWIRA